MLLKYINSNRFSVTLFFLLLAVAFWISSFVTGRGDVLSVGKGVLFGKWIINFDNNLRVPASLLALLLLILNAYLLIQLNIIHIFVPLRTQLPAFFYVILAVSINQLHHLTPALVSSSIIIMAFFRIFSAYKSERVSLNFLDSGLLIATASLFYFPAIFFFLFLMGALAILRPFIWREWVFSLIGLMLPYIFVFTIYYLFEIPVQDLFQGISEAFSKVPGDLKLSQIINWSYIIFFMLIGSYYLAQAIDTMKIHARKFYFVFLVFFLFSVLFFLIIPGAGTSMIYYIIVPLSYLFTYYFVKCKRNWINEIFLTLFIILLIWQGIA